MKPINLEIILRCPETQEPAQVDVVMDDIYGCSVLRCSRFQEGRVTCTQRCLKPVVEGEAGKDK